MISNQIFLQSLALATDEPVDQEVDADGNHRED
jgi:hypothetical protein